MLSWRRFFIILEQGDTISIQMSLNLNILWLLLMWLKNIKLLQGSHAAAAKNDSRWHVDCPGDRNSHARIYLLLNSNAESKYSNAQ